jgi:hypothetical protein
MASGWLGLHPSFRRVGKMKELSSVLQPAFILIVYRTFCIERRSGPDELRGEWRSQKAERV